MSGYATPENVGVLEDLRASIIAELAPSTALGTLFAEDVAMLSWEIHLYRKARGALVRAQMLPLITESIPQVTMTFGDPEGIRHEVRQYLRGDLPREHLTYLGGSLREAELEAEAMSAHLAQLMSIDALLAKAEQRRAAALEEFEAYEGRRGSAPLQPVAE